MTSKTAARLSPRRVGMIQLLVGSFLISFSAVFVKLSHIGPTAAGFYRVLFGGTVLVLVAVARRNALWRGRGPFLWASLSGMIFAVDIFFWHRSIYYVGPGLATILGNFQVFFLAATGVIVFKERVGWRFVVSIPLALVGLFLLVGVEWDQLGSRYRVGVAFGILTAVAYAAYLLILRRSQRTVTRLAPAANLAVISLAAAACLGAMSVERGESFGIVDAQTWVSLLSLGIVCQAVGWIVISWSVTRVEASLVGLMLLMQPTLTFVWDIVFFARPTTSVEVAGAAMALGAIYLGSARRKTRHW